jgi:hypothetical protein
MAYSAELILSGETFTANIIKGSPGDTGPSGIDGVDGVATVPVYNDGTQLTEQISVLKFTGGGKTVTASGNEITVDIPTATNDYTQLINVPTTVEFSTIINVPSTLSGNYIDLAGKPFIPTDLSELADSQGLLSSFIFDGSFTSLTGKPTTTAGYGITDAFDYEYNSLLNKPTLFDFQFASLLNVPFNLSGSYDDLDNLPDLTALNYVTPSVLAGYGYVTTSVLTSTLTGYVQNSTLSNYVTNEVLTSTLNSSLAAYVQTGTLTNYVTNTTLAGYNYATQSYVNSAVAQLIDSSPATLNTLNELAAALGDDPNFATTIATQLGAKANSSALANIATSGSWFDLSDKPSTSQIPESVNLYYTDARVQTKLGNVSGDIVPTTDITYDLGSPTKRFKDLYLSGNSIFLGDGLVLRNVGGSLSVTDLNDDPAPVSLDSNTTSDLAEGTNLYYTTDRANTDFDAQLSIKTTSDLAEGTNLYWTVSRGEAMVDTHLATKNTDDVTEGTNLYYTTARANADFDTHITTKSTNNIAEGANLYYTEARVNSNFATKNTGDLTEGTNLYYTDARVETKIDAYVTGGTGVTVTSGVIAIGQPVATSDDVRFNDVRSNGNVIIDGNLTVSGTTITLDATNLAVEDSMIYLNNGSTVANPDLGIAGNYNDGTYAHAGMFRDATDGTWKFYQGYIPEPDASPYIDTTHVSFAYAPIKASLFTGNLVGNVTGNVTGNLLGNVTGTVSSISNQTTSSLNEGSNLYYTDGRVGVYLANNQYVTQTAVSNSISASASNYATAAQGTKADSALQTANVATVALSGSYSDLAGKPNLAAVATTGLYSSIIGKPTLANVATSGSYNDLASTPNLALVATSGLYSDLAGKPALSNISTTGSFNDLVDVPLFKAVATTGAYADLTGAPVLATVATTGSYTNLSNRPAISTVASTGNYSDLIGAPVLAAVATTNSYSSLSNRPTLGTASANNVGDFATASQGIKADTAVQPGDIVGYATEVYVDSAVANLVDTAPAALDTLNELAAALGDDPNFATTISNAIGLKANSSSISVVGTSGSYADLTNKPTLGTAAATNSNAYATASQGALGGSSVQPGDLETVATSGLYSDLIGIPTLGTAAATNSTAYATSGQGALADTAVQPGDIATVATSGLYSDLIGKPTLGTAAATNSTAYATSGQGVLADSAVQPADLAAVAVSGSYLDLSNKPIIGTAASQDTSAFATAAQGLLADSALQSVAFTDLTVTPTTVAGYGITDAATGSWTLNYFAETTSTELRGVISDETGTGSLVFGTSPTIATPSVTGGTFGGGTFTSPTLVTPTVAVINGSTQVSGTLTLRSTSSSTKASTGILIDEAIPSTSTSTGALVIAAGVGIGGTLSVSEIYAERWTEKLNTNSSSLSGVVAFSYLNGTSYYHTGFLGDFTTNFTNVPVTDNRTIVYVIMVQQGSTAYVPTAVQIGGVNQPINWLNNEAPTGTASNIDQFTFTLVRTNSVWKVLAVITTYGGAI